MSRLTCECGAILSDTIYPNEVTGDIISNKGYDAFSYFIEQVAEDFIKHRDAGDLEPWITKHFNKHYSRSCTPGQMIGDAVTHFFQNRTLDVWECDNCGSLLVQRSSGENRYTTYSPDKESNRMKVLGDNIIEEANKDAAPNR